MKRKLISILVALVLVLSFSLVTALPASADALTSVTATADDYTVGATGVTYTITFTTATLLEVAATADQILITFPVGFDVSGATVNAAGTVTQSTADPVMATRVANVFTLNVAADVTAGIQTIVLDGVVNQAAAATNYHVAVETQDGDTHAAKDGPTNTAPDFALYAAPNIGTTAGFAILGGGPVVTLTDTTVFGDVGSGLAGSTIARTNSPITGTVHQDDATAHTAYADLGTAYTALTGAPNGVVETGTLAGITLTPGTYSYTAAAALTGILTLDGKGNADAVWIFKIGTGGTGALTTTDFNVVMSNSGVPAKVFWWVRQAVTLTDSNFQGTILAGAAVTVTRGTLIGNILATAAATVTGPNTVTLPTLANVATAVANANTALIASANAKVAYTAATGKTTNTVYTDVTTAEAALQVTLVANPQVEGDITAATGTLNTAVTALTAFTTSLGNANAGLTAATTAAAAYIAATGKTGNTVYTDVTTANLTLATAYTATPQVKATIDAAVTALATTVTALTAFTTSLGNANAGLTAATTAAAAYIAATGKTGNTVYTDVTTANLTLATAYTATPQVKATIDAAVTALATTVTALTAFTTSLGNANAGLTAATTAAAAHITAGGKTGNTEYAAVLTANTTLATAYTATPQVKATIDAAVTALATTVTALTAFTTSLTAANTALTAATTAQAAHITAHGLATNTVYTNVTVASTNLTNGLAANPQIKWTIETETTNLNIAVAALNAATAALGPVITNATTNQTASAAAKIAYTAASGKITNTVYTDVTTAEAALNALLIAVPQVQATIATATATLATKVIDLAAFTLSLSTAITNNTTSVAAQAAHITAHGLATNTVYTDVTAAQTVLNGLFAATPQVKADIDTANGILTTKVTDLAAFTLSLGNASTNQTASAAAKLAYTTAGGLTSNLKYADVVTKETALNVVLAITPQQSKANIETATANLATVVATLIAADHTITLNDGWTLVSTDKLVNPNLCSWVGTPTLVYKYTGTGYLDATFTDLKPVEALYVKMPGGGSLKIKYSDAQNTVSSKDLVAGWNLVSSGTAALASAVFSPIRYVGDTQLVGLTTLVSQAAYNVNTVAWYVDATNWTNLTTLTMSPFDGYWIYMSAAKIFGVVSN